MIKKCDYPDCDERFDPEEVEFEMQEYSNGSKHKKAICPRCGRRQRQALSQGRLLENMPFGKYAGRPMAEIAREDPGYLRWLLTADVPGKIKISADSALQENKELRG